MDGSEYNLLHSFSKTDGSIPFGELTYDENSGFLYGTTLDDGENGNGTLFRYDPNTNFFETIYNFREQDGYNFPNQLYVSSDGLIYGAGEFGGKFGFGTIFRFFPSTLKFEKLYDFDGIKAGKGSSQLVETLDNRLFGLARKGGTYDNGVLFSIEKDGNCFRVVYTFDHDIGGSAIDNDIQIIELLEGQNPDNDTPEIFGINGTLSTDEDIAFTVELDNLIIEDSDNLLISDFQLTILDGENYSVQGEKVIPNKNFNGTLEVAILVDDGCADSGVFKFNLEVIPVDDPVLSVVETTSHLLKYFPNPANSVLSINLDHRIDKKIEYEIIEISGRVALKGYLNGHSNQIDIRTLSSGVYVLSIKSLAFQNRLRFVRMKTK